MKNVFIISLIVSVLQFTLVAQKKTSNDIRKYIIESYSNKNFESAIEKGTKYLLSSKEFKDSIDVNILFTVMKSYLKTQQAQQALDFIKELKDKPCSQQFKNTLQFYEGTFLIIVNSNDEAINKLENLLGNNGNILPDSIIKKIYHNLGVCHRIDLNYEKALFYYKKGYELNKGTIEETQNYEGLNISAGAYFQTLGKVYKRYDEALKYYKEVLAMDFNSEVNESNEYLYRTYNSFCSEIGLSREYNESSKIIESFYLENAPYFNNELAALYRTNGYNSLTSKNYTEAINYFERSLFYSISMDNYNNYRAFVCHLLANIYQILEQDDLCSFYTRKAIEESKKNGNTYLDEIYATAAYRYALLNKQDVSRAFIDSAYQVNRDIGLSAINGDYNNQMAWAFLELGEYYLSIKHFKNIEKMMLNDSNFESVRYWDNINDQCLVYLKLKHFNKVEQLLKPVYNEIREQYLDQIQLNKGSDLARLYRRINLYLAKAYYGIYLKSLNTSKLNASYQHLEEADASIDNLRSQLNFDSDQIAASSGFSEFIDLAVKITADLYEVTSDKSFLLQSFEYTQKGKSYSLLLGVNDKQWKVNAGIPDSIISKENHIKGRLSFYQNESYKLKLQKSYDAEILSHLTGRADYYMSQLDSIKALVSKYYPRYFELKYAPQYAKLEEIQQRLGSKQVLIDYHLSDDKLIQFVISQNDFKVFENEISQVFQDDLKKVIDELSTPFIAAGNATERIKQFTQSSHRLYIKLIGNIEDEIHDKDLIIIPHAELAYLPFETLLTEDVSKQKPDFKKYPWLLNRFNIAYEYNSSLLPVYSSEKVVFDKVLSFAPAYHGREFRSDSILINMREAINNYLAPLNAAKEEINNIAKLYNSELFVDHTASKQNFLNNVKKNSVMHLAMHSLNDEIQPLNSQLVFSAVNDSSSTLKAHEIYNYNINSPMVVLSSCSTGRGKRKNGEGLMSLARAFKFAGVHTQIMTLWTVHDQSGAMISQLFYKKLKEGRFKDRALREAKQDYLASADAIQAHPYYWANYVISGNTSPLKQRSDLLWYIIGSIGIISFLSFVFIRRKQRQ